MAHRWQKQIAIDPFEGPHIIWHKIEIDDLPPEWQKKYDELGKEPSPDGEPWGWHKSE